MKTIIKFTSLTITIFSLTFQTIQAQCHIDDWTALKALYESTDGDNWTNRNGWDLIIDNQTNVPNGCNLDDLYGVDLDNFGRVNDISISGNQLKGNIPPEINYLTNLTSLHLYRNELSGTIPSELGDLNNLTYLNLRWNEFSGGIPPELSNLSNLNYLNLVSTKLSGSIPPEIGNLEYLEYLDLANNQLSGSIPPELENLINLSELWLNSNQLSGNIPSQLGTLNNLVKLGLHVNKLNGSIPPELGNLNNLISLNLYRNELNSSIPSELGNLINLEILNLFGNKLSGTIPPQLGNLVNLTELVLVQNNLSGTIPSELGNLNNLIELKLYENDLSGSIPPELGDLNNLKYLHLYDNKLTGSIPPELGNLNNLLDLWLRNNKLSGNIPSQIGNLFNLKQLSLRNNQISGIIPPELSSLSNLNNLHFCNNQLSGIIPNELGDLINLTGLFLDNNELSGKIPYELGNLTNLKQLHLQGNMLSGVIPPQLGNLINLNYLYIQNNDLSGCYDNNLLPLCTVSSNISDNNYFDIDWEDFCLTGAGVCIPSPPDPSNPNVHPGDKNNDGIVDQKDVSIIGFLYETGPPRATEHQNTDWDGYPCEDWDDNLPFNGVNIKHLDCNGDGTISSTDADAVIDNLGETHDEGNNQIFTPFFEETNYQIYLQPIDDLDDNNLLQVNVVLESKNGNSLNLQGGYFTIYYNNINTNIINAAMNFPNSWLGINDINMITSYQNFPNTNQIEIGFSKTNGTNSTGEGIIGQLTFVLDNNAMRSANGLLDFEVIEIGVHDSQGNIQPIEEQLIQVGLNESNCQTNWTITEDSPFYNVYKSNGTIATDGFVLVGKEQQVQYSANRVRLEEGFSVRAGAGFKVRSNDCN